MKKIKSNNFKSWLILITLIFLMVFPAKVSAFSDISEGDWFYGNVISLKGRGIIDGYTDNTFKPKGKVSHGESLKLLTVLNNSKIPKPMEKLSIRELNPIQQNGHWAEVYAEAALSDEILILRESGLNYDKEATRYDVAKYIVSYINSAIGSEKASKLIMEGSIEDSYFVDVYGDGAKFLYESGIIIGEPGKSKNYFRGNRNVTRAEFTAIIDRAEKYVLKNKPKIDIEETKDKYSMINNVRRISYSSVEEYTKNTFELESFIRSIYYMKYHNLESISFSYSPEYRNKIIRDGKIRTDYIDEVRAAYRYVSSSYPELFFLENQLRMSTSTSNKGLVVKLEIISPIINREDAIERRRVFEDKTMEAAKELIDNGKIKQGMSQLEIAKELHSWVINRVQYDTSLNPKSFDGYSALINKNTVCNGYSALYHRMLSLFGIDVVGTTGIITKEGELHIWGEAMLDGVKYYIDPTWNDGLNTMKYFTSDINQFVGNKERTWDKGFFDNNRHILK